MMKIVILKDIENDKIRKEIEKDTDGRKMDTEKMREIEDLREKSKENS